MPGKKEKNKEDQPASHGSTTCSENDLDEISTDQHELYIWIKFSNESSSTQVNGNYPILHAYIHAERSTHGLLAAMGRGMEVYSENNLLWSGVRT